MNEDELNALTIAEIFENTEFSKIAFTTEAEGTAKVAHLFCESVEDQTPFRIVITRKLEPEEDEKDVF